MSLHPRTTERHLERLPDEMRTTLAALSATQERSTRGIANQLGDTPANVAPRLRGLKARNLAESSFHRPLLQTRWLLSERGEAVLKLWKEQS